VTETAPSPAQSRDLPPSALVLVAANLVPLVSVVAFHWTVFSVLLMYWCENVVVGALNVLRMAAADPQDPAANVGKLFLIPFFIFHYGMFTLVHGIFVLTLFGPGGGTSLNPERLVAAVGQAGIWYGVLAMALSHGFSFLHNYLWGGEYRRVSLQQVMFQPYSRVMVLHFTILFGGLGAKALGAPIGALVILVAAKTLLDLRAHLAERRKLGLAPA
jgi:Family of unknown function (DUF6498)